MSTTQLKRCYGGSLSCLPRGAATDNYVSPGDFNSDFNAAVVGLITEKFNSFRSVIYEGYKRSKANASRKWCCAVKMLLCHSISLFLPVDVFRLY